MILLVIFPFHYNNNTTLIDFVDRLPVSVYVCVCEQLNKEKNHYREQGEKKFKANFFLEGVQSSSVNFFSPFHGSKPINILSFVGM